MMIVKGFLSAAWRVGIEGSTFLILIAFTVFHLFKEFVKRYSLLFPKIENGDLRDEMPSILESFGLDSREYQLGKQKIFLRDSQHSLLQTRLHSEQIHKVCVLQRWIRGVLQRRHFIRQRNAAIVIQAAWRGYLARSNLELQAFAVLRIQSSWRMYVARRDYLSVCDRIILLQSHARGYLARIRFRQHKELMLKQDKAPVSPRPGLSHARSLSRSLSDPSRYEDSSNGQREVRDGGDITENGPHYEDPWMPRERSPSKVKDVSQVLEEKLPQNESKGKLGRQRSSSCPNSPENKRRSIPPPIEITPSKPPLRNAYSDLSPIPSPTAPNSKSVEDLSNELKAPNFSRKLTSSIRRRLSSKGKSGQRHSTSDVLDDRITRSHRSAVDDMEVLRTGMKSMPSTLHRSDGGKVKKGLFSKIGRSNSLRRRSDSNLHKITGKKSADLSVGSTSHDDLAKALKQTKIVSCALTPGPVQWKNTGKKFVKGNEDLGELEAFLMNKVSMLNQKENKRDTIVDRVFRKALQEFHMQLISSYSVLMKEDKTFTLKYEDLMGQFEFTLNRIIKSERIIDSFPVIMGVNAFAGVLSEFISSRTHAPHKQPKHHKKQHVKKRKSSELTEFNGHQFSTTQFSIPTFCEHCGGFIWGLEKGFVCQECRFTCHKKCHAKSQNICRKGTNKSKGKTELFGGDLSCLVSNENLVPPLVDKLIKDIEKRGLYTEGLYRKSPSNVAVKKLKNDICTLGIDHVNLEEYTVHVVAGVLKLFFRQLSVPVITSDFYMDFIRTADLKEEKLRLQALYSLIQKLPKASKNTLERLVFHLSRISQHQDENLMNANALSIIWAQCLMGTPAGMSALESMQDVAKQTKCLETLILGQLSKIRTTLHSIRELDKATDSAHQRLSTLNLNEEDEGLVENDLEGEVNEKMLLRQQLYELREQRALLTAKLTSLGPGNPRRADSEEDLASDDCQTDDDLDTGYEEELREEYAVTFDLPATPIQLHHLTKNRARQPVKRRRPTRAKLRQHEIER